MIKFVNCKGIIFKKLQREIEAKLPILGNENDMMEVCGTCHSNAHAIAPAQPLSNLSNLSLFCFAYQEYLSPFKKNLSECFILV